MTDLHRDEPSLAAAFARRALSDARAASRAAFERRVQGRAAAARIAARLAEEPGVVRVILFGSLAGDDGQVHAASDIDLAVAGVPAQSEADLYQIASALTPIPLDLVRLEGLAPAFRARIEREGEPLYVAS